MNSFGDLIDKNLFLWNLIMRSAKGAVCFVADT